MERKLKFLVVFFSAFAIGVTAYGFSLLAALMWELEADAARKAQTERLEIVTEKPPTPDDFVAEFSDLPELDERTFPEWKPNLLDLWDTEGAISDIDYDVKTGERWLVLAKNKERYVFQYAAAQRIKKKSKEGFDSGMFDIRFRVGGREVLATKKVSGLKPGPVKVAYQRRRAGEMDEAQLMNSSLKLGAVREFDLNGKVWRLRVTTGQTRSGVRVGVLALSDGRSERIVDYSGYWEQTGIDLGDVLLAADLDNDGKLDLYLENSATEESSYTMLYLSSQASEHEHVRYVASFTYGGC